MNELIKYNAACVALSEAVAVDEVKDIRDKADAMRIYAMQAKNKSLEIDAAEIRIRAERKLGELIDKQKSSVGLNSGRAGRNPIAVDSDDRDTRPKLSDVGISKDLSSRAQKLAAVPQDEFDSEIKDWREKVEQEGKRVTTKLEKSGENHLLNKPKSEPETTEPEYTELDQLRDDNSELRDRIVDLERLCQIAGIDTGITDDVLTDAKKQIKDLEANLKAVTTSRDFFMNENAQLKRQLKLNKKVA